MGVLDRPAVARDPRPDVVRRSGKAQRDKTRMSEQRFQGGRQRPELERVAARQRGRRLAVLGTRAVVSGAEYDGGEANVFAA
jgi:hypothetical protein